MGTASVPSDGTDWVPAGTGASPVTLLAPWDLAGAQSQAVEIWAKGQLTK